MDAVESDSPEPASPGAEAARGRRRTVYKVLAALISLAGALALIEFALRLLHVEHFTSYDKLYVAFPQALMIRQVAPDPWLKELTVYHTTFYRYKTNSAWSVKYPSNPRGYFAADNTVTHQMNSAGFRDREFTRDKQAGTFRIITVGDSVTFGEGVRLQDTFPKVLEERLRATHPGCEVLNFGVNGYCLHDETRLMQEEVPHYKPDLIIWGYVMNDIAHFEYDAFQARLNATRRRLPFFDTPLLSVNLTASRAWGAYVSRKTIEFNRTLYASDDLWGRAQALLRHARGQADAMGARFLLVLFPDLGAQRQTPYPFASIHAQLETFFRESGIDYIDMTEPFLRYGPEKLMVHPSDAHPNEIAHRLVADELQQALKARRWLPDGAGGGGL